MHLTLLPLQTARIGPGLRHYSRRTCTAKNAGACRVTWARQQATQATRAMRVGQDPVTLRKRDPQPTHWCCPAKLAICPCCDTRRLPRQPRSNSALVAAAAAAPGPLARLATQRAMRAVHRGWFHLCWTTRRKKHQWPICPAQFSTPQQPWPQGMIPNMHGTANPSGGCGRF